MNLQSSYFQIPGIKTLREKMDRRSNPYFHVARVDFNEKPLDLYWTKRAAVQFKILPHPLLAEMQLSFPYETNKRVIFHEEHDENALRVNDDFSVMFKSDSGESVEEEIHPKELKIDFIKGEWVGEFFV